jgi:proton-coupled amino acid transporter
MAILIPKLDIMIPLVGVTSGTLCALVYPPILEMITFWSDWKMNMTPFGRAAKITLNCCVVAIGIVAICAGLYANIDAIITAFKTDPYGGPT